MNRTVMANLLRFGIPVLALAQLVLAALALWPHGAPGIFGGDFLASYAAGQIVSTQGWPRLYDLSLQQTAEQGLLHASGLNLGQLQVQPYDNPPIELLVALPFDQLSPHRAVLAWVLTNGALCAIVGALAALWAHRWWPARAPLAHPIQWSAGIFAFLPVSWGILAGQPVGLMLGLFALAFWGLLEDRPLLVGVALATLAFIKPQVAVGPLLYLLVSTRWSAVWAAVASGAALGGLCLFLTGAQGMASYVAMLRGIESFAGDASVSITARQMVGWRGLLSYLPALPASVGVALSLALGVATFALLTLQWRRITAPIAVPLGLLAFTAGGLLAAYHTHYQDVAMLVILAPALLTVMPRFSGRPLAQWALAAALTLLLLPSLAWLVIGVVALVLLPLWLALGIPALVLCAFGARSAHSDLVAAAIDVRRDKEALRGPSPDPAGVQAASG